MSFCIWYQTHRPLLIRLACFLAILVQMAFLVQNLLYPAHTTTHMEITSLAELPFPAIFKVCVKPAYSLDFLNAAGYRGIYEYFLGESRYNNSIFGWAGHTSEGETFSDVSDVQRGVFRQG